MQGDSGGPLTIEDDIGAHILTGIVSKRLGDTCSQQDFAVFTNIFPFLPWIESSIKDNGGMTACGFDFSAPPSLGMKEMEVPSVMFLFGKMLNLKQTENIFLGKSLEPPSPPGLVLLGGQSGEGQLTSVETFGFGNCTIPPLPETRYAFGSFTAPTQPPQLAVCGGWWMGKPNSTDCLTLNVTSGQWERGTFTNGLFGDVVRGVVEVEGQGVFVVHNNGISFLAPFSDTWVTGPMFPVTAECACKVRSTSFVTIHLDDTRNVQEYFVIDGRAELKTEGSWPNLLSKRQGPGCGATSHNLVVAGGIYGHEVLATVEVIHLETKALRRGGNLRQPRAFFQMIPVGLTHPRLMAIGGHNGTSASRTSEWWEEEENSWEDGPDIATERFNFAAQMAPPNLVCSEVAPPAHSCPAGQIPGQACLFTATESGM